MPADLARRLSARMARAAAWARRSIRRALLKSKALIMSMIRSAARASSGALPCRSGLPRRELGIGGLFQRAEEIDPSTAPGTRSQAAGMGQQPKPRACEALRLLAERGAAHAEGVAIGADAEKRDDLRLQSPHLGGEAPAPDDEFLGRDFIGGGGSPVHKVGDAVASAEQLALIRRMQEPCGEARGMQRGPEAVAGPGEVMAGGGGVQTGIDADEQHPQIGADDVADAFASGAGDLGRCRFTRGG